MDNKLYRVPEANLSKLNRQIEILNRRAVKLGVPVVQLIQQGHEDIQERVDSELTGRVFRIHTLSLLGETPKLAGWSFLATIQHLGQEGNIIRSIPGVELPAQYRSIEPLCEHCNTLRRRVETFVVKHEDGTLKQVGRQCIADFLGGANPEFYLNAAEVLLSAADLLGLAEDSEDRDGCHGYASAKLDINIYLRLCAVMIREHGFTSRKKAQESPDAYPTANRVQDWMGERNRLQADVKRYAVTPADEELASKAIAWAQEISNTENDYLYNLSVISKLTAIESNMAGLVASLIPAYQKAMAIEVERKAKNTQFANSQYVGTPGVRENFTLTVASIISMESQFGVTVLYRMADANGNLVVWFSSHNMDWDIGNSYSVKATVKKHDEYKGIKQTTITRAKVL